ncbi:hypothetical protein JKP88DRAFT_250431 [Tribonema minus]|uniref:Uncharacterized protein n=1 Tax=Tribonema minus TaxID=303371 RepID=A0A835YIF1_9STRA|nr:hypothetical protein JKP88DRAFT_250431 [Tribonema minus]
MLVSKVVVGAGCLFGAGLLVVLSCSGVKHAQHRWWISVNTAAAARTSSYGADIGRRKLWTTDAASPASDGAVQRQPKDGDPVHTAYSLPLPQHLFAVEHDVHVLITAAQEGGSLAPCIDSVLRQDYRKLHVWVHGNTSKTATAWATEDLDTRYASESHVRFLSNNAHRNISSEHLWALKQIRQVATPNDLIVVMDSKHIMATDDALVRVNARFVDKKSWLVHGLHMENDTTAVHKGLLESGGALKHFDGMFTFKAFLTDHLLEDDFHCADGKSKGAHTLQTQHLLRILELAGKSRVAYTPSLVYTAGLTPNEDIHVFLCVWGRKHLLQKTIHSLMRRQTVSSRIRLHVWNNNPDIATQVDLVSAIMSPNIDVTHSAVNLYSYARFLDIKQTLQTRHIDYAIIVDDDQLFPSDYIEKLYAERRPKAYVSWWGRQFNGQSYFNGTPSAPELIRGLRRDITDFDYAGNADHYVLSMQYGFSTTSRYNSQQANCLMVWSWSAFKCPTLHYA